MILVEKKVLKEKRNCLVMVIRRKKNFSIASIKLYLKKKNNLASYYHLKFLRLKKISLKRKLLFRYQLPLLDKNSRVSRSIARALNWKKNNIEKIRRFEAWKAKQKIRRAKRKKKKSYIKLLIRKRKKFDFSLKIRWNANKRVVKIDKKSIYFKDKRKLIFLLRSVYSYLTYANYRYRFFYRKFILPRFRFRVFRHNLVAIRRRLNRRFRVIKPINFNKLKFIGDYYTLYDLRFYYNRLRFLKQLAWQTKKVKRKKVKQITKLYKFQLINFFITNLITRGNKQKSFVLFFDLLFLLKYKHKLSFLKILYFSILNVKPLIFFRTMYIGGKKYKIPVLLSHDRGYKLGIKWIISQSNLVTKNTFLLNLIDTLLDSYNNIGDVVKKRKEYHLAGFENKSYIRFLRFLKK